jgi:hypothetical protein
MREIMKCRAPIHLVRSFFAAWMAMSMSLAVAKDHVIILTISNYAQKPLLGVKHDANNALQIANRLGYDTTNAVVLKDDQLRKADILQLFDKLPSQIQPGDRVFFYYSGHGASMLQGSQCVQSIVSQDESLIGLSELAASFDKIKQMTSNVVVILDACHSGGLQDLAVTRSLDTPLPLVTTKAWNPRKGELCYSPSNFAKGWNVDSSTSSTRSMQLPQSNFVFIAAAKESEVALDDSAKGGLATLGLLDCVSKPVPDTDGSGAISAAELAACAQGYVAVEVPKLNARTGQRYGEPTIEVNGNPNRPLNLKALHQNESVQPLLKAAYARKMFEQIVQGANSNWRFNIEMPTLMRVGEQAHVRYKSNHPGYVSVFYIGSDGKDISILADNIHIKETPVDEFSNLGSIPITEPAGSNVFLTYISSKHADTAGILAMTKRQKAPVSRQAVDELYRSTVLDACESHSKEGGIFRNAGALLLSEPSIACLGYAAMLTEIAGIKY